MPNKTKKLKKISAVALEVIAESIKRGERGGVIKLPSQPKRIVWNVNIEHMDNSDIVGGKER